MATVVKLPTKYSVHTLKKAMDRTVDVNGIDRASIDWIEIRFAEVLMSYGEAANEIGNTQEALQVLKDIRNRQEFNQGMITNMALQQPDHYILCIHLITPRQVPRYRSN